MTMTTMHCNGLPNHRGDDDDDGNDGHPDHDHVFKDAFAALPPTQRRTANHSTTSLSWRRPGGKRYGQLHIVDMMMIILMIMIMINNFCLLWRT